MGHKEEDQETIDTLSRIVPFLEDALGKDYKLNKDLFEIMRGIGVMINGKLTSLSSLEYDENGSRKSNQFESKKLLR
ncbi:MAG: hypothetical protein ISR65_15720 [Bacteriovoracaceae bacterium]|nr:hypothetical protein [Bacteriovoracaceae bacterium]